MSNSESTLESSVGIVETRIARIELPEGGLELENGQSLPELEVAYESYGTLSPENDNAVFICHALTMDAHVAGHHGSLDSPPGWWDAMVGPGKGIDTNVYFVVCANILGGCKGTTGPSSTDPRTGKPYGPRFPNITVNDIVRVHRLLLKHLGIERVAAVIGGSLGGMQAIEWTVRFPASVDRCVCIASATSLSAQALAFDVVGRRSIVTDPEWHGGDYYDGQGPDHGLSHARMIGHITYLSEGIMAQKFGRERSQRFDGFEVESYLRHQAEKFIQRFDANSYLTITRAIDEYDLAQPSGSLEQAVRPVQAKMLMVSLSDDWLFPPERSVELANALLRAGKDVSYCNLSAPHGHDAFLVDVNHLAEAVRAFLPWVGTRPRLGDSTEREAGTLPQGLVAAKLLEKQHIVDMVSPGASVLDLGCGGGELLSLLAEARRIRGLGVDFDIEQVIEVIDRGHDVFQADIDAGLAMIPDGAYDYAILSETLQLLHRPRLVLRELLRVARQGIVSFPNFGKWSHRLDICLYGRMPKDRHSLPFEWYETPNIHLFTLKDFEEMCLQDGVRILNTYCLPQGRISRGLLRMGFRNLGADRVLVQIARDGE